MTKTSSPGHRRMSSRRMRTRRNVEVHLINVVALSLSESPSVPHRASQASPTDFSPPRPVSYIQRCIQLHLSFLLTRKISQDLTWRTHPAKPGSTGTVWRASTPCHSAFRVHRSQESARRPTDACMRSLEGCIPHRWLALAPFCGDDHPTTRRLSHRPARRLGHLGSIHLFLSLV